MLAILLLLILVVIALAIAYVTQVTWARIKTRRVFVKPTEQDALQFSTPLQGVDTSFFLVPDVPVVWVWRRKKIDIETLRKGLQRTLNRVPIVAGRLVVGKECLEIRVENSQGCMLTFVQRESERLPTESCASSNWSPYGTYDPVVPPEPFARPFLDATLTHFAEGCCLYVKFSHMLMDGAAMSKFMQIWSYETSVVAELGLKITNPPDVVCDHRMPAGASSAVLTEEDLGQRQSFFRAIAFTLSIAWHYYTQQLVDYEFTTEQWTALKDQVSKDLPEGEWISSYEAIMATVMTCIGKSRKTDALARVIVNIRGRSKLYPTEYIGCGLGMHEVRLPKGQTRAASTAQIIHNTLRTALKDVSTLEKSSLIPHVSKTHHPTILGRLFGGRLDVINRARYVLGWEKSCLSDAYILNSWVGYPWLDFSFGLSEDGDKPYCSDFMRVPPAFRSPRQTFVCPIAENKFQLRMSLPRAEMKAFQKAFKAMNTGFKITEDRNNLFTFPLFDPSFIASHLFDLRNNVISIMNQTKKQTSALQKGDRSLG